MLFSQQAREEAAERKTKTLSAAMRQPMPQKKTEIGSGAPSEPAVPLTRRQAGVLMPWRGQVTVPLRFSMKMRSQTPPRNTLAAKLKKTSQNGAASPLMTTATMARVAEARKTMDPGTSAARRGASRTKWTKTGLEITRGSS